VRGFRVKGTWLQLMCCAFPYVLVPNFGDVGYGSEDQRCEENRMYWISGDELRGRVWKKT